jgi:hypothetical protein
MVWWLQSHLSLFMCAELQLVVEMIELVWLVSVLLVFKHWFLKTQQLDEYPGRGLLISNI